MARDDFSKKVKEELGKRVGMICSNPDCRKSTSGPHDCSSKSVNIGVAAHITGASKGGARYDPSLSPEERSSIDNGIWLCQNCAKLVDNDEQRYPVNLLKEWKCDAEERARCALQTQVPGDCDQANAEPELSQNARRMLLCAAMSPDCSVFRRQCGPGYVFKTYNETFNEDLNPRSVAGWNAALQELMDLSYLEDRTGKGFQFHVSLLGFSKADVLLAERLLLETAKDEQRRFLRLASEGTITVAVGSKKYNENGYSHVERMLERAVALLEENGLIEDRNGQGNFFYITTSGLAYASSLSC